MKGMKYRYYRYYRCRFRICMRRCIWSYLVSALGKVAKKIVPFSRVSTLRGGRGSAGIKLTLSFFMTYFFVGMFQKWSKMTLKF